LLHAEVVLPSVQKVVEQLILGQDLYGPALCRRHKLLSSVCRRGLSNRSFLLGLAILERSNVLLITELGVLLLHKFHGKANMGFLHKKVLAVRSVVNPCSSSRSQTNYPLSCPFSRIDKLYFGLRSPKLFAKFQRSHADS